MSRLRAAFLLHFKINTYVKKNGARHWRNAVKHWSGRWDSNPRRPAWEAEPHCFLSAFQNPYRINSKAHDCHIYANLLIKQRGWIDQIFLIYFGKNLAVFWQFVLLDNALLIIRLQVLILQRVPDKKRLSHVICGFVAFFMLILLHPTPSRNITHYHKLSTIYYGQKTDEGW